MPCPFAVFAKGWGLRMSAAEAVASGQLPVASKTKLSAISSQLSGKQSRVTSRWLKTELRKA
jgi:hypothetical protein